MNICHLFAHLGLPKKFRKKLLKLFLLMQSSPTCKTRYGPAIHVDWSYPIERSLALGEYERRTLECFSDLVAEGEYSHFVDVGANVGFYSLLFDRFTSGSVQIDLVEPLDFLAERAEKNCALNGVDVRVHQIALADVDGTNQITVSFDAPGQSTLGTELCTVPPDEMIPLSVRRMDTVDWAGRPDLLKIDVEGLELAVLRGGATTLTKYEPDLLMEFHTGLFEDPRKVLETVLSTMAEYGYEEVTHIGAVTTPIDQLPVTVADEWPHLLFWSSSSKGQAR